MKIKQPRYWYTKKMRSLSYVLLPFSWLFGLIVLIRQQLYRYHIFQVKHFSVPVIVVGNITIGGTGKTPFVIWLANFLRSQGYKPGIVSRGAGGKQQVNPHEVNPQDAVSEVGDEALLLSQRTACPLVIGINRAKAVEYLLQQHDCDVVISDDGLQHYRLGRAMEIVMVDAMRGFGNQQLLPAGPLREPLSRLEKVDLIVKTGETMALSPSHFVSVKNPQITWPFPEMTGPIDVVAGIGHPERFFTLLKQAGLEINEHIFTDHHCYTKKDFAKMTSYPILMTEKDAVKCRDFADERYWYLQINTTVDVSVEKVLLNKLREAR